MGKKKGLKITVRDGSKTVVINRKQEPKEPKKEG